MPVYTDALSDYIRELFAVEDKASRSARERLVEQGLPAISVRAEEGRFLQVLVAACRAKRALEIGTLGGYSGIWIARGLLPGGRLITLEVSEKHAEVARSNFEAAGVDDRIEIRLGDAHETLATLTAEPPFDFIFIDAEKSGYDRYFDWAVDHLRPGGVLAAHNAFRGGRIVDVEPDEDVRNSQRFNARVAADPRVLSTIFPGGDGTLIAVKQ